MASGKTSPGQHKNIVDNFEAYFKFLDIPAVFELKFVN